MLTAKRISPAATLPMWLILAAAALTFAGCGKEKPRETGSTPPGDGGNGSDSQLISVSSTVEIVLEAEDAAVSPPMVVANDDASKARGEIFQASAGKYVDLPEGVGKGDKVSGKVAFKTTIEQAGRYRLWARVWWTDGCGNSFGVAVDNGPQATIGEDGTYNSWQWVCLKGDDGVFRLSKGKHTIEFRNTEDGARLDQIYLTTNLDEQAPPQGILSP
ncbi:MAG TPA: hypothetical protein VM223_15295 [Planctomycetota bacterium]|nr:hypothetical protein [Planctomycetota bacterium]